MTKIVKWLRGIVLAMLTVVLLPTMYQNVSAKTVEAKLSADTVKVGSQISVSATTGNVTFSSSDSTIACVNTQGVVTGKKEGRVTIFVKRKGYTACELALTVKASKYKPTLPVAADEVELIPVDMSPDKNGKYVFSAKIKNNSESGNIKKIVYHFLVTENTGKETGNGISTGSSISYKEKAVSLTARSIKAGETSELVSCQGDCSGDRAAMKLTKISIYSGKALYEYNVQAQKGTLSWGVKDTTAPVFSGWIEGQSKYNGCVLRVCYADRRSTYDFKDHISVVDDRDKNVEITVDDSRVNWDKEGIYRVIYTAKDQAGNVARTWTRVQVLKKGTAEELADSILASITKSSWSDERKARAIYSYVANHCTYVHSGGRGDYRKVAVNGIRYHSGDCYTYYSMSRLLLTRAGIPNIRIQRYPTSIGEHYWNLTYVNGGWYHFDTCPRTRKGYFCLQTDAQLRLYSTGYTFRFNKSLYPKRATKVISRNPI